MLNLKYNERKEVETTITDIEDEEGNEIDVDDDQNEPFEWGWC